MNYLHSILCVDVPAHTELVQPILVATSKQIPVITAISNFQGNNFNTIAVLSGIKMVDIPKGFQAGFSRFFPLRIDMLPGEVFSVGFFNSEESSCFCKMIVQYYFR